MARCLCFNWETLKQNLLVIIATPAEVEKYYTGFNIRVKDDEGNIANGVFQEVDEQGFLVWINGNVQQEALGVITHEAGHLADLVGKRITPVDGEKDIFDPNIGELVAEIFSWAVNCITFTYLKEKNTSYEKLAPVFNEDEYFDVDAHRANNDGKL